MLRTNGQGMLRRVRFRRRSLMLCLKHMNKLKKNESGFSAVEVLLILVILAMIGFLGWYVWRNNTEESKTPTVTNVSDQQRPMQKYDDNFVSFNYPKGWSAKRINNKNSQGTKTLKITSPKANHPLESFGDKNTQLVVIVFLNSDDIDLGGCDRCVVHDVIELNNTSIPNAKLAFTEEESIQLPDNKADKLAVFTSNEAIKAGDIGYGTVMVGNKSLSISADFETATADGPEDNFTSINALKATQAYKDLVGILESLAIK